MIGTSRSTSPLRKRIETGLERYLSRMVDSIGKSRDENKEAVKGILDACQGLPVALGVAGEAMCKESQLRQGPKEDTWSDVNKVINSRLMEQHV